MARSGEGVAGAGFLEAHHREDLAGAQGRHALLLHRVHEEEAGDPLLLAGVGVPDRVPLGEAAGVEAQEYEAAPLVEQRHLEGQRQERGALVGGPRLLVPAVRVHPGRRSHLQRGGEVVAHGVEHLGDALVAQRRSAQEGHEPPGEGGAAQRGLERRLVEMPVGEDRLGGVVVGVGERLEQRLPVGLALGREPLLGAEGARVLRVAEADAPPRHQVLEPLEGGLGADGAVQGRDGLVRKVAPHGGEGHGEVGAHPVHLVGEGDAGHAVAVGLAPHRLALGLDAVGRVEDRHRAVEHSQAPLHLDGEVHVAGGVDEVQLVAAPVEAGHRRGDGDASLALEVHPVHHRGAVVHLAHPVRAARGEEEPLGERGLSCVDVGHDAEVADGAHPPLAPRSLSARAAHGPLEYRAVPRVRRPGGRSGRRPADGLRSRRSGRPFRAASVSRQPEAARPPGRASSPARRAAMPDRRGNTGQTADPAHQ